MKIHEEIDVIIYDYETIKGCFLASYYIPEEDKYYDFLINDKKNDLYSFVAFNESRRDRHFVGFNNIGFDSQVQEYIYQEYHNWYDKTGLEIAGLIAKFAGETIENQTYNLYPKYPEDKLNFKQLDVPRILHWFNDKKMVSLKQAEFELRAENIENFEVDHNKALLSDKEVEDLIFYCHNDVKYTFEILKYVLGLTDHPLYSGKDKIQDRLIMIKEFGLPCLNWDDVKIGAEWNKKDYVQLTGKDERFLKPLKVNHFYGKKFKTFFPDTVSFQSEGVKKFVKDFGETYIKTEQKFQYSFHKDLKVTVALGGLHSCELPRYLKPGPDELFIQNDIGSQYPNTLRKLMIYPEHLGKEWYEMLIGKIQRRLDYKAMYKKTKDPKYNSLQEMGKLSLNGGAYGRLNTPGDWQQDPCAMLKVTIACQLEILMIVEALILKGFNVTSCNTDGWDSIVPKARLSEYFDICEHYEEVIRNKEMGQIEFTVFAWMAQLSVNSYVAEKIGVYEKRVFKEDRIVTKESLYPHLKLKDEFTVDFLLSQNSSFRVIPLAMVNYFDKGVDPKDFINNHDDIFDFCARSSSGKAFFHEATEPGKKPYTMPKILRYYVAKQGIKIKKRVNKASGSTAHDQNVSPAEYPKIVCNRLPKSDYAKHLEQVNRQWYIDKAMENILKVETGKKNIKKAKVNPDQTSLF